MPPIVDALLAAAVPRPGDSPLTQNKPKALLEIASRRPSTRARRAAGSTSVRSIVIVGLTPEMDPAGGAVAPVLRALPLGTCPVADRWLTISRRQAPGPGPARAAHTPAGHEQRYPAAGDGQNVTTSLETDHDAHYSLVPRAVMESRFGRAAHLLQVARRRLRGADLSLLSLRVLNGYIRLAPIIDAKNVLAQAQLVGYDVLVLGAGLVAHRWAQDRIRSGSAWTAGIAPAGPAWMSIARSSGRRGAGAHRRLTVRARIETLLRSMRAGTAAAQRRSPALRRAASFWRTRRHWFWASAA
jgi:hypothetical protein